MPQRMIYHPMNGISTLNFIARVARHLLSQRRFLALLNIRFSHLLPPKGWRQNRSVNHCRNLSSKFPKTDASAFLKQSKSLRFLTEISSSALAPPMLLPRLLLTRGNFSSLNFPLSSLISHLSSLIFHLEFPLGFTSKRLSPQNAKRQRGL